MNKLIYVNLSYACYGLEVDDKGFIADAPPIARWMIGKHENFIAMWLKHKGAKVIVIKYE